MNSSTLYEISDMHSDNGKPRSLSIVVDDFDDSGPTETKEMSPSAVVKPIMPSTFSAVSTQSSSDSIQKILKEAESRKDAFRTLLDEHKAVVEKLKMIEQHNSNLLSTSNTTPTFVRIKINGANRITY